MSRTLLSARLKELTERGIVTKQKKHRSRHNEYQLTKAGEALSSVVFGMADWSQEWLQLEPSLENLDADHLFWSLRRSARPHVDLPNPFIVNIYLTDQTEKHQNAWLVFKDHEVELCIVDHDYEVDVQIEATTENLTKLYMGWSDFSDSIRKKLVLLRGPQRYTDIAHEWLGRSRLADIRKQPREFLVS